MLIALEFMLISLVVQHVWTQAQQEALRYYRLCVLMSMWVLYVMLIKANPQ